MTLLEGLLLVLGFLVSVLVLGAAGLGVFAWFDRCVIVPWVIRISQAEHDRRNARIRDDSWWFSEDEPTRLLLLEMSDSGWDVGRARERWRKRRRELEGS